MRATAICLLLTLVGTATGADIGQREAVEHAKQFWAAVARADTKAMQVFYAEKVTLKAGSELLKKQWEIPGAGDRGKDLLVDREDLIAAYRRMIEKLGKDRWTAIFSKIDLERVEFRFAKTADGESGDGESGVEKGDLTMTVFTGPGDDALFFFFRHSEKEGWQVVAEATDY